MFFPELLYQLSARDQQVTWLDPQLSRVQASNAATSVGINWLEVPVGRALVLTNLQLRGSPGLAQACTRLIAEMTPRGGGTTVNIANDDFAAVANLAQNVNWSGEIIIPADWIISVAASFDAGAAANSIDISGAGILIPLGNVQRI